MNFCSHCGHKTEQRIPQGDNRVRDVCDACGTIHYANPKNVCGAILEYQGKVLLCKRAIEPRYGLWTVPAGFMENGETLAQAAARETLEEANARAQALQLFGVISLPHISQVYVMFHGSMDAPEFSPGVESLETQLFDPADIPWSELAFPVVRRSLEIYLDSVLGNQSHEVFSSRAFRHPDGRVEWSDD